MYVFSGKVTIPSGTPLGGYGRTEGSRSEGELEVHGWGVPAGPAGGIVEVCSVDALYAGSLARERPAGAPERVIAATHTHTAPMLDESKPRIGPYAAAAVSRYREALEGAVRLAVNPDRCTVLRSEVELPIYRRFDHPDTAVNRALASRAGIFPNPSHPLDQGVYLFVFAGGGRNLFAIVSHACHPVTRHDLLRISPDYVGALRAGVLARFGTPHCLFFLGCAGDVRPNFAEKRTAWLPRSRFNWRFRWPPTEVDEREADRVYRSAVAAAREIDDISLAPGDVTVHHRTMVVEGMGVVDVPEVQVGARLSFAFLPFEVSHRYHLDAREAGARRVLVTCAGDTRGYLPHPTQLRSGGYEVDGSREAMGLARRVWWSGTFT